MDLMPHVQALLDELIDVTKNIVVKRNDIANVNDEVIEDANLFYLYRNILNGEDTFNTYDEFPRTVLENTNAWLDPVSGMGSYGEYLKPLSSSNATDTIDLNGVKVVNSSKEPTLNDESSIGDVWVYHSDSSKDRYCMLTKVNNESIKYEPIIPNGSTVIPKDALNSYIRLYVKNNQLSKDSPYYIQVVLDTRSEYIEINENNQAPDGSDIYVVDGYYGIYRLEEPTDSDDIQRYYRKNYVECVAYNSIGSSIEEYVEYNVKVPYYYIADDVDENNNQIKYISVNGIYIEEQEIFKTYDGDETDIESAVNKWIDNNDSIEDKVSGKIRYVKYTNTRPGIINFNSKYTTYDDITGKTTEYYVYDNSVVYSDNGGISYTVTNTVYESRGINEETSQPSVLLIENKNANSYYTYDYYGVNYVTNPSKYIEDGTGGFKEYVGNDENIPIYVYATKYTIYSASRVFSDTDVDNILYNSYKINQIYADNVVREMRKWVLKTYCPDRNNPDYLVKPYKGEQNSYYRELNGLPPVDQMIVQPKVDRMLINPAYKGSNKNPYVYELTDSEIEVMRASGELQTLIDNNVTLGYLKFLGKDRIDVMVAREASPFEIIRIGTFQNFKLKDLFYTCYKKSRNYIMRRFYHPEMFEDNIYYGAYISILMLLQTLTQCMSKSGEILIENWYTDYDTTELVLKDHGFEDTFDTIPMIYRKNIAKNIKFLIRNKGIDKIYEIIYGLFGIYDVEVFKYYFRKIIDEDGNIDLSLAQVPVSSENIVGDICEEGNRIDYDKITESDKYWGTYYDNASIKEAIENMKFNYMNSKYITLNNKFNLTELNFNTSYLLNYIIEVCHNSKINIQIPIDGFSDEQPLISAIVALFAIQSAKYGFSGNIPSDVYSIASVYQFNLNVIKDDIDRIIEKYSSHYYPYEEAYITKDNSSSYIGKSIYLDGRVIELTPENIGNYLNTTVKIMSQMLNVKNKYDPPIILPEISADTSLEDIATAYRRNLVIDNALTNDIDEDSLYNEVLDGKTFEKNFYKYLTYKDILKLISTTEAQNDAYEIQPVWEPICRFYYTYNDETGYLTLKENDTYKKEWTGSYPEIDKVWTKMEAYISDITFSNTYVSQGVPSIAKRDDLSKKYAINCKNHEIPTDEDKFKLMIDNYGDELEFYIADSIFAPVKKADIDDNKFIDKIILNNNSFITSMNTLELNSDKIYEHIGDDYPFYIEIVKDANEETLYNATLYKRTNVALTYMMYVRETAPELYSSIVRKDGESFEYYAVRLNELHSIIIASIEEAIGNETLRKQLKLSYNDFTNIAKYIKKVIDVFKSYTVDLASMDVIYTIDDYKNNRIKILDTLAIKETMYSKTTFNFHDTMAINEIMYTFSKMRIKDEIIITEIKNN